MNELSKLLQENLNIEFISATLSNPKNKDGVQKVKVSRECGGEKSL